MLCCLYTKYLNTTTTTSGKPVLTAFNPSNVRSCEVLLVPYTIADPPWACFKIFVFPCQPQILSTQALSPTLKQFQSICYDNLYIFLGASHFRVSSLCDKSSEIILLKPTKKPFVKAYQDHSNYYINAYLAGNEMHYSLVEMTKVPFPLLQHQTVIVCQSSSLPS